MSGSAWKNKWRLAYSSHSKRIHLYGKISSKLFTLIEASCKEFGVQVTHDGTLKEGFFSSPGSHTSRRIFLRVQFSDIEFEALKNHAESYSLTMSEVVRDYVKTLVKSKEE